MSAYTQQSYYLSVSSSLGKDKFLLRAFRGEEALSELFFFELEMESEDASVNISAVMGKPLVVTFLLHGGSKRLVHGLVTRFSVMGASPRFTRYRAEIRPWFWMMTLIADCQIFQNKSVPEIIEEVFKALGFQDYRNGLTRSYDKREYCVQYNETAFNFLSRLMEEEGIFYYFEHAADKHTLVLSDDAGDLTTLPGAAKLTTGQPRSGEIRMSDTVLDRVVLEQSVVPGAIGLGDYSFETPLTDLNVSVEGDAPSRKIYTYPGEFKTTGQGEGIARLRLQAAETPAKILHGEGQCRAMLPGYKFTLAGQSRAEINTSYILRRVSHQATPTEYRNTFQAFPADVPFRPPLATPQPRVFGCQTAVVVGKAGEEIWTDEYGRIKVQFHWDRKGKKDEKSSCWIRVDQSWAGKQWGSIFLPRIGQEVLVTFLEGDPDRPIVSGALYNADQKVPYALPGAQTRSTTKTRSTKGGTAGNEIRFEDKKNSEELYIHAQKDYNIEVENSRTATIIKGDESLIVKQGQRKVDVQKGNETHDNAANFTHTVKGDYSLKVQGNLTIDVTGSISIKSGTSTAIKAGTKLESEGGVALSTKAPSITQQADATQTVDGGGMLTLKGGLVKIN